MGQDPEFQNVAVRLFKMDKPRLQKKYYDEVTKSMKEKFGITNINAVPKIDKIVINMGVGRAIGDMKILESAMKDLAKITGQQPVMTRSKKDISNFKLRANLPIGCKVTLRRARMYEFMDRLFNMTLPRIRDFGGISLKSFDEQGNYSFGLSEQTIFPEIDPGRMPNPQGMHITFVFNQGNKEQNSEVLRLLGLPFKKK